MTSGDWPTRSSARSRAAIGDPAAVPRGEPGPWTGLRVLVTAGGTREPIDSVRFIGNRSSGRMGMALAAAAAKRGAEVTLVAANVSLPEPTGVKRVDVETTAELSYETVERFETQHVLLMAAAPADFRTEPITGKIKRQDSLNLNLQPTEDILARSRPIAARARPSSASPPSTGATPSPAPAPSSPARAPT